MNQIQYSNASHDSKSNPHKNQIFLARSLIQKDPIFNMYQIEYAKLYFGDFVFCVSGQHLNDYTF